MEIVFFVCSFPFFFSLSAAAVDTTSAFQRLVPFSADSPALGVCHSQVQSFVIRRVQINWDGAQTWRNEALVRTCGICSGTKTIIFPFVCCLLGVTPSGSRSHRRSEEAVSPERRRRVLPPVR